MIARLVDQAVAEGVFPAAQVAIARDGALFHASAHGGHGDRATGAETLFDIASLTKVVATTSLVAHLLTRKELGLDDPVGRWFPGAATAHLSLRQLLSHTSGLPAWLPLFASFDPPPGEAPPRAARPGSGSGSVSGLERPPLPVAPPCPWREQIVSAALDTAPAGAEGEVAYSDVGFLVLGAVLEHVLGQRLDAAFDARVAQPLGLERTAYRPLPRVSVGDDAGEAHPPAAPPTSTSGTLPIAPTGLSRPRPPARGQPTFPPWRQEEAPGEVDDDNAWAMGGVAPHAGLFSTATDVARWGVALLEELEGAGRLCDVSTLRELLHPVPGLAPPRSLGFDRPSPLGSSAGSFFGAGPLGAVGHLGFTGCSVWLDLDRRWVVVLLSNRTYPSRTNDAIRTFRPRFHDEVAQALERKT